MKLSRRIIFAPVLFCLFALVVANVVDAGEAVSPVSMLPSSPPDDFLTGPQAGDALDLTLRYLQQNRQTWGLTEADLAEVVVTDRYVNQYTGVTYLYLVQRLDGIEVFNGVINATIMPDGRILSIGNRFIANLSTLVKDRTPALTAIEATAAASNHLALTMTEPLVILNVSNGPSQKTRFNKGGISLTDIEARLVYDASGAVPRLAWNVVIYQTDGQHWWNVRIDANSGAVLSQNDWVSHDVWQPSHSEAEMALMGGVAAAAPTPVADGSRYRVFHLPIESPIHAATPSPADGRTLEHQPADAVGSPLGWHDSDGVAGAEFTTTQGNNGHAYTDTDANNIPDPGSSPDGGPGLAFDFPLDLTQPPSTYRPAAVTNLFHWTNLVHDVNYRYGFDEASGNFQANNYGLGGLGNDYVRAEGQDGGGTNGANFATPPDGQAPRMQLMVGTFPNPDIDMALDNGIVAHEYGHGISTRLTGGPGNVNCLNNAEQMGEGWSDWIALIMLMEVGDAGPDARGLGTYYLGQPPNGPGIRLAPYSTNLGVNNYTYGDLPGMGNSHNVGFVWATMLWEMNWALIGRHGFDEDMYRPMGGPWTALSGNQLAHQLVMDGMKIQPCSPGFVDGRNAILAADMALSGGANQCAIWTAFAKRGLGFSASQGSSNSISDGTEAFDLPTACTYLSLAPAAQTVCQGEDAVYTVSAGAGFSAPVALSVAGNPAPTVASFDPNPVNSVPAASVLTISNTAAAAVGTYPLVITATDVVTTAMEMAELTILAAAPGATTLVSPGHGATGVPHQPTFAWTAVAAASDYLLAVATDAVFANIVYTATVTGTTHTANSGLAAGVEHFWRVTTGNGCGTGGVSAVFAFTTAQASYTIALPIMLKP